MDYQKIYELEIAKKILKKHKLLDVKQEKSIEDEKIKIKKTKWAISN